MMAWEKRKRRIHRALERAWPDRTRGLIADAPPNADRPYAHVCLIIAGAFEGSASPSDNALTAAAALALSGRHSRAHGRLLDDRPDGSERDRLILAGDLLQAKAFEAAGRLSLPADRVEECYAVLTRSCMRIYAIASTTTDPERTAERSAALAGAAARLGGLVGGASDASRGDLGTSGARFGRRLAAPGVDSGGGAGVTGKHRVPSGAIDGLATLVPDGQAERVRDELGELAWTRG